MFKPLAIVRSTFRPIPSVRGAVYVSLAALLSVVGPATAADRPDHAPNDAATLFNETKVWTVHLKLTAEQWRAMEPKRRPAGGAAFGRRPSPARAAELLAPVIMSEGDGDRDGRLSTEEFAALGRKWYQQWDKDGAGQVSEAQVRVGFDAVRSPRGTGLNLVGPEGQRNGIASVLGVEFDFARAELEFEGRAIRDVAVRFKGNGTFLELGSNPKRSFKIDLDKHRKGQNLGGVTTLNLQNNITDASWMNEVLAYRLYRDAGVAAPRTTYARVSVTVEGQFDRRYYGLYSVSENVDERFTGDRWPTKARGALFKPVTPLLFADMGADWAAYNQMYDPKWKPTVEQKKAVTDLCRLVSHADDAEFAARIGDAIDLPHFARFLAVMVYLSDIDGILGPGQNHYLFLHPETGKLLFIPWDQDRSWGQFARASQDQRNRLSLSRPWQGDKPFFERLFKVGAFRKAYFAALEEFSTTIFEPDRIAKQVDQVAAAIRPAIVDEPGGGLERFDLAAAGKPIPPPRRTLFGGGDTQPVKPFAVVRTASVRDQLAGKSEGLTLSDFPGRPPGRSELGVAVSGPLFRLLAGDQSGGLTADDAAAGLRKLFESWDTEKRGQVDYSRLRAGIEKSLTR